MTYQVASRNVGKQAGGGETLGDAPSIVGVSYAMVSPWAVPYPNGAPGDLLIAVMGGVQDAADAGDTYAISADNGGAWSAELAGSPWSQAASGRAVKKSIRWKIATTEDSEDSETVSFATGGGGPNIYGMIIRMSDVNQMSPIEAIAALGTGTSATAELPEVAPLGDNRTTIFVLLHGDDDSFGTFAGGSGPDQTLHSQASTPSGADRTAGVVSAQQTTAVTVTGKTFALGGSTDAFLAVGFAAKPTGS